VSHELEHLRSQIQAARSDPGRVVNLLQEILRRRDDWLDPRYQVLYHNKPTAYPLYDAPDGSCSIVSLVLPAGKRTPIHTHAAWAVLAVYKGRVRETWFRSLTSEGAGIVPERMR
jgi:3-mercaptopropionate dioxygenase